MVGASLVCLDVGEKRIGVAVANSAIKIAIAFDTIIVDGTELQKIAEIVIRENAKTIIVGYPRNQQGEVTAQTNYVELFAKNLETIVDHIIFQDESLTSVIAEQRLIAMKKPYSKADIDAQAAVIILEDYMESN